MPSFPAFTITNLGLDMQAQAELGGTLVFTRIALGAGAAADPATATALVDQRMTSNVQEFVNMGGGNVRLRAVFSNLALVTGFGMSEVGVFALDPTTSVEKLYSYTKTTTPDYMPPLSGPIVFEQIFDAIIAIGSATNVTAVIDNTVMIATKDDTLYPLLPKVTVGAGGATTVDLTCASAGYDEISIVMQDLFKQGNKAYLQAALSDGTQESIEMGAANALIGSRSSRVWLSRALALPDIVGTTTGSLTAPQGVAVDGNYAYLVRLGALSVIDISNPTAPTVVGTVTGLSSPHGVAVEGNYAYVSDFGANTMLVIDITTKTAPSVVGTATGLSSPWGVAVSGNYAYVANNGTTTMSVIDITTKTAPSVVGTATGLSVPRGVAVSGNYAYVANSGGNSLKVIDVTTKTAPTVVGTATGLTTPYGVAVSGNYAYVANGATTTMSVVDVTTKTAPAVVGTATGASGSVGVAVSGNYAYVASGTGPSLLVVDVSIPTAPTVVGTATGLTSPVGVATSGNYAYVANGSVLSVVDSSTPAGGRLRLWRGDAAGMQFDMTMASASGRRVFRAAGRLPSWTTKLTVASLLTGGLLEGGKLVIRGRKLAP